MANTRAALAGIDAALNDLDAERKRCVALTHRVHALERELRLERARRFATSRVEAPAVLMAARQAGLNALVAQEAHERVLLLAQAQAYCLTRLVEPTHQGLARFAETSFGDLMQQCASGAGGTAPQRPQSSMHHRHVGDAARCVAAASALAFAAGSGHDTPDPLAHPPRRDAVHVGIQCDATADVTPGSAASRTIRPATPFAAADDVATVPGLSPAAGVARLQPEAVDLLRQENALLQAQVASLLRITTRRATNQSPNSPDVRLPPKVATDTVARHSWSMRPSRGVLRCATSESLRGGPSSPAAPRDLRTHTTPNRQRSPSRSQLAGGVNLESEASTIAMLAAQRREISNTRRSLSPESRVAVDYD